MHWALQTITYYNASKGGVFLKVVEHRNVCVQYIQCTCSISGNQACLGYFLWRPGTRPKSLLSHRTDLNINAIWPWLHETSKSFFFFFLGYFEYFKPGPVQCLNKLWHWAILTLSPTTDYILMSLVCGGGGFPLNTPWPESSTGGTKGSIFGWGEQDSAAAVGKGRGGVRERERERGL